MTHRCKDCGARLVAAAGFRLPSTEEVSGRTHTHGSCIEYLKAARVGAEREIARLRAIIPTCTRGPKACDVEIERLRSALDEIAMNAENLKKGGLPHFSREEFADTVAFRARHALSATP